MSIHEAVAHLGRNRISLWEEQGALRFRAPQGSMHEEARALLKPYRDELRDCVGRFAPYPCILAPASLNQAALWFIQKLDSQTASYNVALSFRHCTRFDPEVFSATFRAFCNRHDQLRTSFAILGTSLAGSHQLCQIIPDHRDVPVRFVSCVGLDEEELEQSVSEDYLRPFDLGAGPLLRCTVFVEQSGEPVVLFTFHHSIIDAWSLRLLVTDFFSLYQRNQSGVSFHEDRRPTRVDYIDYTLCQAARGRGRGMPSGSRAASGRGP